MEEEALPKILVTAIWAPSHANSRHWEFIRTGPRTWQKLIPLLQERMENASLKRLPGVGGTE